MSGAVELALAMLATVLVTWAGTGAVRRSAFRHQLLDIPNARSSHATPTPRGGGLAIVVAYLASVALLFWAGLLAARVAAAFAGGGALIAAVGYADDHRALSARTRFAVHAIAAVWAVALIGGLTDGSMRIFGLHGSLAGIAIAFLAITWMTNLFNFMDGIDGIAASEAVFVACASAFIGWRHGADPGLVISALALAAASLGFLSWNWPPARIFMGDVGSAFLGFSLAALAIAMCARDALPIEVFVILGGVFIVDATVTLLRRLVRGDRWYEAHRSHAYQHLARRWKGHLPVTSAVIVIDLAWLLPWAYAASEWVARARWFAAAALAPLVLLALICGAGRREKTP
jgi:glycosyltransferase WbpL